MAVAAVLTYLQLALVQPALLTAISEYDDPLTFLYAIEEVAEELELTETKKNWLVDHPSAFINLQAFTTEVALEDYSDYTNSFTTAFFDAQKMAIRLGQVNRLEGPVDQIYHDAVNTFETVTNNPYHHYLIAIEVASLRLEHPEWSPFRLALTANFNVLLEELHLLLDLGGLFPAVGEIADITNGVIYTLEGDVWNASLSYSAAVPFAGWFSTGVKWARMGITGTSGRLIRLKFIVDADDVIHFGRRAQLRTVLKPDAEEVAHHIIPWANRTHLIVQQAAKAKVHTFHPNDFTNGINLSEDVHIGNHLGYNNYVRNRLEDVRAQYGDNITPDQAVTELNKIISDIRQTIADNPDTHINNLF